MLVAHIPAGYIVSRSLLRSMGQEYNLRLYRIGLIVGLIASILPDMDLLYFYFLDDRQHVHHSYLFHRPFFWAAVTAGLFTLRALVHSTLFRTAVVLICINVLVHLLLDSVTGGIAWLFPLTGERFVLFHVPARYDWWIWNFLFHWTFSFEILLLALAAAVFCRLNSCKQGE